MGLFFPDDQPAPKSYPHRPGAKKRDTSFAAADAMALKVGTIRERVLAAIKLQPGTPEEIGRMIGEGIWNTRPRCSELAALGLIEDSGVRRESAGGKNAIVWKAVA